MKKSLLILLLISFSLPIMQAQDIIVLKDASEITSKVLEISETNISYKKWDNPDGPTYSIPIKQVATIRYANGSTDVFNKSNRIKEISQNDTEQKKEDDAQNERPFIKGARFHAYQTNGFYVGESIGIDIAWSLGVRVFDYGYIGVESGFNCEFRYAMRTVPVYFVPILLNTRAYIPINKNIHPFIECSSGVELDCSHYYYSKWIQPAFKAGIGFDIYHFSFSLGYYGKGMYFPHYSSPWLREYIGHNFYFKIGVQIGKRS